MIFRDKLLKLVGWLPTPPRQVTFQNFNKEAAYWSQTNIKSVEEDLRFQTRLSELAVDLKCNLEDNFKRNAIIYLSC